MENKNASVFIRRLTGFILPLLFGLIAENAHADDSKRILIGGRKAERYFQAVSKRNEVGFSKTCGDTRVVGAIVRPIGMHDWILNYIYADYGGDRQEHYEKRFGVRASCIHFTKENEYRCILEIGHYWWRGEDAEPRHENQFEARADVQAVEKCFH